MPKTEKTEGASKVGRPKKAGRPTKGEKERKGELIRVRVTTEQKDAFTAAADRAGYDVSTWLRGLGVREVQRGEQPATGGE